MRTRPVLLYLVYGVFLVVIVVTATAQAMLVSSHFTTSLLNSTVANDAAIVRLFVNSNLLPEDLTAPLDPTRSAAIGVRLDALTSRAGIVRAELLDTTGTVLVADTVVPVDTRTPRSPAFHAAADGQAIADLVSGADSEASEAALHQKHLIREYLPIISGGRVFGVFALWRDADPILERLEIMRRDIVYVTIFAAIAAGVVLYLTFRSANTRIRRQTEQLLDAERRDALTGLLNHGSIVSHLTERIEAARGSNAAITVAIVDVDNFRLLNETYGHPAGDSALQSVAELLVREVPAVVAVGRYGPDEFLVVAEGPDTPAVGAALVRLAAALTDFSLQFGPSERLPVTISAGVAAYPENAESATALLSAAAVTVAEAKASGGDAIRHASEVARKNTDHAGFDVLQGLVIAVDTKDRYTKRHSEDVARYALFLADQIGLDRELRETLRIAGLLHDVGKIAIPDDILRKPGMLTPDEQRVVEQHVALGDAIVRSVPNLDVVRAAVRHHHERWDGRGYLDHLAGEEIPFIARVIAVGDVFSAMTTSRPYRKALPVEEALTRLGDAAGAQLDERLVKAFIHGIETAANPPLPGQDIVPGRLWTPVRAVA